MRFSITLVRQKIDELVIILQSGTKTGLQIGQVEILCDDIDRLIRNALMATGQQALPAADNGIPRDSYSRIRDIMPQCLRAFVRSDIAEAVKLAEEAGALCKHP
jgi:hypothetical protein